MMKITFDNFPQVSKITNIPQFSLYSTVNQENPEITGYWQKQHFKIVTSILHNPTQHDIKHLEMIV